MFLEMFKSKLHCATITEANLNYKGSITIDEDLLDEAGILIHEKVQVVDINNGERFETYTIRGERGSRIVCVNGAAARKVQVGDSIIVIAYAYMSPEEAQNIKPKVVVLGEGNAIDHIVADPSFEERIV
ncbi:Aspartate 1-decarboxylase [hydrothermal vent metagenome]|uniref:Aspartate 1-decarboxylase n=1 Tax=hydrothermal vent metagenome TaxID=652676 RepID=A0A1W1CAS5_9ZZZZ